MKLKIGKIPYLNSVMFYYGLESNPETLANMEFVPMVPSRLSSAAAGGQLDAGPVPLVTSFEVRDTYEPLADFCIATIDKARSILFFSKKPMEMLNYSRIGVTHETSTSVRLLKLLFSQLYRVTPNEYVSIREPSHGFLLIGDSALRNRGGCEGYPYITDLGEAWHGATGLPFVFAVWMVRRTLPEEQKSYLKTVLSKSLNEGWKHFDAAVGNRLNELNMTRAEAREYLDGFHFRIGAPEHDAIAKFKQLDSITRGREASGAAASADPAGAPE
jgi:chorismate dehydratase